MVILTSYGNGTSTISNQYPSDNENIILTCIPDPNEALEDIIATDSAGHSIALPVQTIQTIRYRSAWGDLILNVYYSGSTPPFHRHFPLWLLLQKRR